MNYQRIHDSIIERARNRIISGYSERHHIVPRCLGGSDDQSNIVSLTAEEHYVVHQLLVKINPGCHKLATALLAMSWSSGSHIRSNKLFGWCRRRAANASSVRFEDLRKSGWVDPRVGTSHSEDSKKRMSESAFARWSDPGQVRLQELVMSEVCSSKKWLDKRSESQKRLCSDPVYLATKLEQLNRPEAREQALATFKAQISSMSSEDRQARFATCKGRFWITDGTISKFHDPSDSIPEGWFRGRHQNKRSA